MMFRLFWTVTCAISLAYCKTGSCNIIEECMRPAKGKIGNPSMLNIDYIYMINLDKRPEKYQSTMKALEPYGIFPYRFSAVNGWDLSFEAIEKLGVTYEEGLPEGPIASVFRHEGGMEYVSFEIMKEPGVAYYCHSLSRGAIGCILSHLSVLQDAYDSGYRVIWVLEDDIQIIRNPHELSSLINVLDNLAPDWDVLFTDDETKNAEGQRVYCGAIRPRPYFSLQPVDYYRNRSYVNEDIIRLGLRFGSYSMIIKRPGMKKILDYFKANKIYFPYDIDYRFVPEINMYSCTRDIVTTTYGGISDNAIPTFGN